MHIEFEKKKFNVGDKIKIRVSLPVPGSQSIQMKTFVGEIKSILHSHLVLQTKQGVYSKDEYEIDYNNIWWLECI